MKTLVLALAAVLLMGAQAQTPRESIDVTVVEVPVTVIDSNGKPIRGLTRENFEVYDDGKRREVTHFDAVDVSTRLRGAAPTPATAAAGAAAETDGPLPEQRPYLRNFMLLFDVSDSSPAALKRAREAALDFVNNQLQPVDRVAVGTVGVQRGFELLANFTLDREFARAVITTVGETRHLQSHDPLLLSAGDYDFMARNGTLPGGLAGGQATAAMAAEQFRDLAREQRKSAREEQRHGALQRIENLAELGRVLDRIAGRKQVVLLSEGFDAKAVQGREDINNDEAQSERSAIEHGQLWNVDTEARYGSADALNTLQRMVETLRRSDVVLHALDIKGLRNALDETGQRVTSTESLSLLTRDTGGSVFQNSNDLRQNFARLLEQQDVTYILGFQTWGSPANKFHNLRVKLVNVPAGARISHRMGYYDQSKATVDLDRTLTAGEILTNSVPVDDVRMHAFTAAFPYRDGVAQAPVVLEIDGSSLVNGISGNNTLPAEIFVYAFDRQGVPRDFVYQKIGLELGKLRDKLEAKGVKFYHTLLLPPGDYSVRALVRTEKGRSGFASVPLHVAASTEATFTPALLDESDGWVMVKAPNRAAAPEYPFVAGENVFVPAVQPALLAGQHYEVALMMRNVPVENLQVTGRIDGNGATQAAPLALLGRTPADATGGVKLMFQLTPPKLAPGEYQLVMTMRPPNQAGVRTVSLPFEVQ
jgi:VWFA-related protein